MLYPHCQTCTWTFRSEGSRGDCLFIGLLLNYVVCVMVYQLLYIAVCTDFGELIFKSPPTRHFFSDFELLSTAQWAMFITRPTNTSAHQRLSHCDLMLYLLRLLITRLGYFAPSLPFMGNQPKPDLLFFVHSHPGVIHTSTLEHQYAERRAEPHQVCASERVQTANSLAMRPMFSLRNLHADLQLTNCPRQHRRLFLFLLIYTHNGYISWSIQNDNRTV